MKLINQSCEILNITKDPLSLIERAARTCYQSEPEMYYGENDWALIRRVLRKGHESVIEHASATVKFITNRGVTHEMVRHRIAAYSQESTRYCNYGGKDMEFILPVWWDDRIPFLKGTTCQQFFWIACRQAEYNYNALIKRGWTPQQAREVLPNALKTEIITTYNFREWRHVFKLRCSKAAHPQMRALMQDCLQLFKERVPVIFEDINIG